jgi:hypothetical protein
MTTTTATTQNDLERAHALEQDLAEAGAEWVTLCESIRPLAARLARLEAAHRATANLAGCTCVRPGARQDATEVLMAAVAALQPHTPFASQEAGEQAALRLTSPCACTRTAPEV